MRSFFTHRLVLTFDRFAFQLTDDFFAHSVSRARSDADAAPDFESPSPPRPPHSRPPPTRAMGEQAKPLLPFLQRGDELQRADPKVAYYCRMFACEEGMRTSDKTPEMRELLSLLVLQLEKTKPSAGLQGAEEDEAYVENFALRLFAKADKLDRGGRRDAKTAKLFYVASIVIETLRQARSVCGPATLVPIRPRPRCERRSLRPLLPGASLRARLAHDPDAPPRRLSPPSDPTPSNSAPTFIRRVASRGTTRSST